MRVLYKCFGILAGLLILLTYSYADSDLNGNDFMLENISVVDYQAIKLDFSLQLNNSIDTIREFNITNKNDNLDTFDVVESIVDELDPKSLYLLLDRELEVGNEYELIVTAITSIDDKSIELGLDGIKYFVVNKIGSDTDLDNNSNTELDVDLNTVNNQEEDFNSGVGIEEENLIEEEVIEPVIENNMDLNSANYGIAGMDTKESGIEKNSLIVASNSTALPKTGAEHILLIIVAILIGAIIYIFKYKKTI